VTVFTPTVVHSPPVSAATVWCPSCGAEYVAGSQRCSDCRVALVAQRPRPAGGNTRPGDLAADDLVELGEWPRLAAQILRRRLETAGITVMVEWSGPGADAVGTLVVPEAQSEFAEAVVNEIDVDDEVPDTSPVAYLNRIEEHLAAAGALLDELRTRLDDA
jgi:hypothetical protein